MFPFQKFGIWRVALSPDSTPVHLFDSVEKNWLDEDIKIDALSKQTTCYVGLSHFEIND